MNNIFLQKITNFLFLKTHFSQNLCNLTIKPSYRFSSRTFLLHDLSIQIIIRTISFFIYLPAFFSIHCLSLLCSFSLLMIISNMAIEFHLIRLITNLHYLIKHTTSMSITFKSPTNEKNHINVASMQWSHTQAQLYYLLKARWTHRQYYTVKY